MNMKKMSVNRLVRCAVIAAVYVVVCLALAPFSYGAVQVRVAEALCLLPFLFPETAWGLGNSLLTVILGYTDNSVEMLAANAASARPRVSTSAMWSAVPAPPEAMTGTGRSDNCAKVSQG